MGVLARGATGDFRQRTYHCPKHGAIRSELSPPDQFGLQRCVRRRRRLALDVKERPAEEVPRRCRADSLPREACSPLPYRIITRGLRRGVHEVSGCHPRLLPLPAEDDRAGNPIVAPVRCPGLAARGPPQGTIELGERRRVFLVGSGSGSGRCWSSSGAIQVTANPKRLEQ